MESRREVRPWDLLNPKVGRVPDSVRNKRLQICESCELLNTVTKTCVACGCFMALKTKLPDAFCPKGKWEVHTDEENDGAV